MNTERSLSNSTYADQTRIAERELAAFFGAVTELFGPQQAKVAAEDWLDEAEVIDSPPRSTTRDWRAVTIAASTRLASRLMIARHHRTPVVAPTDTNLDRESLCQTDLLQTAPEG